MQFSNARLLSSNRSGNLSEVNFNNFMKEYDCSLDQLSLESLLLCSRFIKVV